MTKQLATQEPQPISTLALIGRVVDSGVTAENVAVVERMIALRRDEVASENKAAFNRAFFALKREISGMDFYADKSAKTKSGAVAYTYCSESEISEKLEPVLFKHGFAMLFGQKQDGERVTAAITLIHESGHEEPREYTVTRGRSNDMKDATSVDASATTSAWRHLVIKLFGLKSRIREDGDARNIGANITKEQAEDLQARCLAANVDIQRFLKFARAESFEKIPSVTLPFLELELARRESAKKPDTSLAKEDLFK